MMGGVARGLSVKFVLEPAQGQEVKRAAYKKPDDGMQRLHNIVVDIFSILFSMVR